MLFLTPEIAIAAPATSDCVTATSGDWNARITWTDCGGSIPGVTDNAFVQSGHVVSLTQDEAVNDLHVSTGTTTNSVDGVVAIGAHQLDLYGKLRTYKADIDDVPGESNSLPGAASITILPGQGSLRVTGDTRTVTNSGELGSTQFWLTCNGCDRRRFEHRPQSLPDITRRLPCANRIAVDTGTTGEGDITIAADGSDLRSLRFLFTGLPSIEHQSRRNAHCHRYTGIGGSISLHLHADDTV